MENKKYMKIIRKKYKIIKLHKLIEDILLDLIMLLNRYWLNKKHHLVLNNYINIKLKVQDIVH
jgi:hypothetical protein